MHSRGICLYYFAISIIYALALLHIYLIYILFDLSYCNLHLRGYIYTYIKYIFISLSYIYIYIYIINVLIVIVNKIRLKHQYFKINSNFAQGH